MTCRDVLGAGSVLGHHPVTAALVPHKWAWEVNKNPDRHPKIIQKQQQELGAKT